MDDLVTRPAYVLNLRWDVIAWNAAADKLFGFSSQEHEQRNILRIVFANPDMRWRFYAWREDAPKLLAQFRYDFAMAPDDPSMLALVEALTALSPDFRRWWQKPDDKPANAMRSIMATNNTRQYFRHETLVVDEHRHLKMVVYFADQAQR